MKLLITGSSGFVGRYVVAAALRQGHQICTVLRPQRDRTHLSWTKHKSVEILEADLSNPEAFENFPTDIDGVVHLAASKSGDFDTAYRGTVVTTEHLLQAMEKAQIYRLILISSFSVYDYLHHSANSVLDETWPMDKTPDHRDAYAQTKIMQEQRVREFASRYPNEVTILRPGMIFGREMLWNACHGVSLGSMWLQVGSREMMPLSYVENCAEAIIKAIEVTTARGQTLNIVDDFLPSRQEYTQALLALSSQYSRVIPMSWPVLKSLAYFSSGLNQRVARGKLKLPGLLNPARLEARFRPLKFSNQLAKECLDWKPSYSWRDALSRTQDSTLS